MFFKKLCSQRDKELGPSKASSRSVPTSLSEETTPKIQLTRTQQSVIRTVRFIAKSINRLSRWEKKVNSAVSFEKLMEDLGRDIFSEVKVTP